MIFASSSDKIISGPSPLTPSSPFCPVDLSSSFFNDCLRSKNGREKERGLSLVWDLGPLSHVPGSGKVAVLRNIAQEAADPGARRPLLYFWPRFSPGSGSS